ncbi:MAG: hypothetical protein IJX81_05380 [Clostridia bacterium]|nr:hypothetical protein [Clostridia bacterium]
MNVFKKLWNFLWDPPLWAIVVSYLLTVLSAGIALFAVATERTGQVWVYPVYALAALSLFCAVVITVSIAKRGREIVEKLAGRYAFIQKILKDDYYRSVLTTMLGLAVSFLYSAFIGLLAILGRSAWYGALAAYNFIFACMRAILVNQGKKADALLEENARLDGKARACAMNGWFLMILSVTLAVTVILQIAVFGASFRYAGLLIYAFAAYAFFKITMAIVRTVKMKRQEDYIVRALIMSNFAAAAVSILSLQTALLDAFSGGDGINLPLYNGLTGGAVCIFVALLGVASIRIGRKKLREIGNEYGRKGTN